MISLLRRPRSLNLQLRPISRILHKIPRIEYRNRSYPSYLGQKDLTNKDPSHIQASLLSRTLRVTFIRWAARPSFAYEVVGLCGIVGGFYLYHLETVPISNRRRFNVIRSGFAQAIGKTQYGNFKRHYEKRILPDDDPRVIQTRHVLKNLIESSDLSTEHDWKVTVIDEPEVNAFVIPGGYIFVYTGILKVCDNDDNSIAAILGHEIGHNVANHISEQISKDIILLLTAWFIQIFWDIPGLVSCRVFNVAMKLPGSRNQESEADRLGLMIMARSCYDPEAAVKFWQRMQMIEKEKHFVPEFLSTHPSSHNRALDLEALLPQAYQVATESKCNIANNYVKPFKDTTASQLAQNR